jgi:hypothetical protein
MIDFLTGIIQDNEQGMADCVDRFHVTDLLLIPVKEDIADVLILTSSCQGILNYRIFFLQIIVLIYIFISSPSDNEKYRSSKQFIRIYN